MRQEIYLTIEDLEEIFNESSLGFVPQIYVMERQKLPPVKISSILQAEKILRGTIFGEIFIGACPNSRPAEYKGSYGDFVESRRSFIRVDNIFFLGDGYQMAHLTLNKRLILEKGPSQYDLQLISTSARIIRKLNRSCAKDSITYIEEHNSLLNRKIKYTERARLLNKSGVLFSFSGGEMPVYLGLENIPEQYRNIEIDSY